MQYIFALIYGTPSSTYLPAVVEGERVAGEKEEERHLQPAGQSGRQVQPAKHGVAARKLNYCDCTFILTAQFLAMRIRKKTGMALKKDKFMSGHSMFFSYFKGSCNTTSCKSLTILSVFYP